MKIVSTKKDILICNRILSQKKLNFGTIFTVGMVFLIKGRY